MTTKPPPPMCRIQVSNDGETWAYLDEMLVKRSVEDWPLHRFEPAPLTPGSAEPTPGGPRLMLQPGDETSVTLSEAAQEASEPCATCGGTRDVSHPDAKANEPIVPCPDCAAPPATPPPGPVPAPWCPVCGINKGEVDRGREIDAKLAAIVERATEIDDRIRAAAPPATGSAAAGDGDGPVAVFCTACGDEKKLVIGDGPLLCTRCAANSATDESTEDHDTRGTRDEAATGVHRPSCPGGGTMAEVDGRETGPAASAAAPPRQETVTVAVVYEQDAATGEHRFAVKRSLSPPPAEAAPMRLAKSAREVGHSMSPACQAQPAGSFHTWACNDRTEVIRARDAEWLALVEAARRGGK